jgi:hypothetical protein
MINLRDIFKSQEKNRKMTYMPEKSFPNTSENLSFRNYFTLSISFFCPVSFSRDAMALSVNHKG